MLKRLLSTILALCMTTQFATVGFAQTHQNNIISNNNQSEIVDINSIQYTYMYSTDNNGNAVVNVVGGNEDSTIITDKLTGVIYINGIVSGQISNAISHRSLRASCDCVGSCTFVESKQKYISWAVGTSIAAVAAILGTALGMPASACLAGAGVLASACSGGTISWYTCYQVPLKVKWKTTWDFTASTGDYYGPYKRITER